MTTEKLEKLASNGECRSCHAPIRWERTIAGRAIPMDLEPRAGGNLVLIDAPPPLGPRHRYVEHTSPLPDQLAYVSHFATCPQAAEHRRRREAGGGRTAKERADNARARRRSELRADAVYRGHW